MNEIELNLLIDCYLSDQMSEWQWEQHKIAQPELGKLYYEKLLGNNYHFGILAFV